MLRKIAVLTSIIALSCQSLSAQERDFRKERAELDRQEREQKRRNRQLQPSVDYGTNILSVSPFAAMDVGIGVGISYEKILSADQSIGIVFPAYVLFDNFDDNSYYGYENSGSYFYFAPGLKIYPFGHRKATYSIGPNLFVGGGTSKETTTNWNGTSQYTYIQEKSIFRLGILVNNYMTFQFTKSFNLGLQGGLGVRYIDRETTDGYTNSRGIVPTAQFSVTLGYRF